MKNLDLARRTALGASLLALSAAALPQVQTQPRPPQAARIDHVVKSPHGDRQDEYHWLRDDDPQTKRPEVLAHLNAENAYTQAMLAPLQPLLGRLTAEMRARIREDDSSVPVYDHGWWYWQRFESGAEFPLQLRQRGGPAQPDAAAAEELLLDEAALARGQPYFELGSMAVSPDGQKLAWTEDTSGRRILTLRFRELQGGEPLTERISGVTESLAWANDGRTLFYIRQDPVTLQGGPIYRHRLGSDPATDTLVFEEPDKTLFVSLKRSASGRHILIHIDGYETSETRVLAADDPSAPPRVLLARRPGVRHGADHLDGRWVIRTNERALNYRLVEAPEAAPDERARWKTLVPARKQESIDGFVLLHGAIAIEERVAADTRVRLLPAGSGGPAPALLGQPAVTTAIGDHRDPAAAHLRYAQTSMVMPTTTFDLHLASGRSALRKTQPVPGFEAAAYRTARVWAPARDGARVPVTLAWRHDKASRDGRAPLLIEGYGAYGSSSDPGFSSASVSLMDRGFVRAIAHVRGGAEMGQRWYENGRLKKKKNSFSDFVAVTDHLVRERWGAADKVFAAGGSAGGLLMGAVANLAGERYRGMALNVPFVDVVTTLQDETIPLTVNEWSQWGDPRRARDYRHMLSYSPYDQIAAKAYPAMLVTTGLWDSQVQYYEPAKYVARLRARKTDANPLLFHIDMAAGHGGRSGRFEQLQDAVREYAFFIDLAGIRE